MELPVTGLMQRIDFTDFVYLSEQEQLEQIKALQLLRLEAIRQAHTVKTATKSATRNKAKTSKGRSSVKSDQKKLAEVLAKLSPEQIAAIKQTI